MIPSPINHLLMVESYLSTSISSSLASGIREAFRKGQLFDQVQLHLHAKRQHCRRQDLLAYAALNYPLPVIEAVLE